MKFPIITTCVVVLSACAGSNAARQSRDAEPGRDADVILPEELSGINGSTVYDAVRQLRPAWIMRSRPTAVLQRNQAQLMVYVDGVRYGAGMESLRTFPLRSVASVRYFSPGNAEARFGPGHLLGAIEVITTSR
ncbi:MAG TPA: hypothetical protein VK113_08870 [Gemmatimonadales bacterium]|jgi:hypothetical protein|nr:hypothetical protein [Gemmatimonadales bacterium]